MFPFNHLGGVPDFWLEKAYEERSDWVVNLTKHQRFDDLRSDPRFADLVRRVGLQQ
jgi:hypothetical protein